MVNKELNIANKLNFPNLFISGIQKTHYDLKKYEKRLKEIDTEVIILEDERRNLSFQYFKLKGKLENDKQEEE